MLQSHGVCQSVTTGIAGYNPFHEVQSCLDISRICILVYTPVVLGTGAQALIFFAFCANIDRKHAKIFICYFVILDVVVSPGTILIEDSFAKCKFAGSIFTSLTGQQSQITGRICDVKIEDLFVVVQIGSLDSRRRGNSVCLIFIVQRQVCQMCLKSPVRGGIKTGRSKCTFYAKVILVSLNTICNFLQCFEVVSAHRWI